MKYITRFELPVNEERILNIGYGKYDGYLNSIYPVRLFSEKQLEEIEFDKITILYGGNGSGKSTLLNLIAEKLELNRIAPFNSSELFSIYVEACNCHMGYDDEGFLLRVPNGSRIITSDDIFDYMLSVRTNNEDISENKELARNEWANLKFGETVKMHGMKDYEALRLQVLARTKSVSRRKFIKKSAGEEVKLNSNGETALKYFIEKLENDTLYCLDEPENSMSPKMQMEFVEIIKEMARYCGCQFIIATHSPFVLAIENAKIYNLDSNPVKVENWWELENVKIYYDFFKKNAVHFNDK